MNDENNEFDRFIAEYFEGQSLPAGLETRLEELGMDSLELLEFVMQLEERCGANVNIEDVNEKMTLGAIRDRIRELMV